LSTISRRRTSAASGPYSSWTIAVIRSTPADFGADALADLTRRFAVTIAMRG
jgi:hypothetical protein